MSNVYMERCDELKFNKNLPCEIKKKMLQNKIARKKDKQLYSQAKVLKRLGSSKQARSSSRILTKDSKALQKESIQKSINGCSNIVNLRNALSINEISWTDPDVSEILGSELSSPAN